MTGPIDSSEFDKTFFEEISQEKGAEKLRLCFNCNGCSTGCPMTDLESNFSMNKFLRLAGLGLKDRILSDPYLWYCTTCYKCQERCPEEVLNVDTLLKIRTMAVKEGHMLAPHRGTAQNVVRTGHGVPINDATKQRRIDLGLAEIPPTVHMYPEAYDEVKKLVEACGFDELIKE